MKVFVTFLFIVSSVCASAIHEPIHQPLIAEPAVQYAAPVVVNEAKVTTGVSSQSRAQDNQGNYAFAYKEDHNEGGTFRKESGNALGQVIGSYGLRTNDGRVRIVNYVADDLHGFRASIATNEPGTAAQAPAATSISSPHAVVQPAAVHVAAEEVHAEPTHAIHAAPQQLVAPAIVADHGPQIVANHGPQIVANHGPQIISNHEPQIVANHEPQIIANHGPQIVANHGPQIIANHGPQIVANHGPQIIANHGPQIVANHGQFIEAPATLIKSYASSIYGPSLLTDNILFAKQAAVAVPVQQQIAYEPPLNTPVNYGVPEALQAHDGSGYYEPTLVYSNPSGIGYSLGTNVGQFGYQLTYKKKKK